MDMRAGKIFLWARSPVAPKKTSASDRGAGMALAPGGALEMAAELISHGRQHLAGEVGLAARGEALEECAAQHGRGRALLDRGGDGPAALAGVRDPAGVGLQIALLDQRDG